MDWHNMVISQKYTYTFYIRLLRFKNLYSISLFALIDWKSKKKKSIYIYFLICFLGGYLLHTREICETMYNIIHKFV